MGNEIGDESGDKRKKHFKQKEIVKIEIPSRSLNFQLK